MKDEHMNAIYRLVQNTLNFCGNTLEASKEYCLENGLDWKEAEAIRFEAIKDFHKER